MVLNIPEGEFAAYIFDCDGTLADSMPQHYKAWLAVLEETRAGIELPEALFYEMGGIPTVDIVRILNERHGTSMDPVSIAARKEEHYLALIETLKPIEPVVDFVNRFYGKVPLAVASGGRKSVVTKSLTALGIQDRFVTIVGVEDYKRGKPFPDPFLEAARQLGVPPNRCLVFEDTAIGIQAAEAAGMQWVLVPQPERKPE